MGLSDLMALRRLTTFLYSGNEIEYIPPIIQRFIDRVNEQNFDTGGIYNDAQNVHDSTVQKSIQQSIFNVIKTPVKDFNVASITTDPILDPTTKRIIMDYCEDTSIHTIVQITFQDLFAAVWTRIQTHAAGDEIKRIMNTELQDSQCKCFTGRLSRLVNCLVGFCDDVQIQISDRSQINNIVILVKDRLGDGYTVERHRAEVEKEMTERGFGRETIAEIVGYIE